MKTDIAKYITQNLPEHIYLYVGKKPAIIAIFFQFYIVMHGKQLRCGYFLNTVLSDQKKNLSKSQKKIQRIYDQGNSRENIFSDRGHERDNKQYTDSLYYSKPCLNDKQLFQNMKECKEFLERHNLIQQDNKVYLSVEDYETLYFKWVPQSVKK